MLWTVKSSFLGENTAIDTTQHELCTDHGLTCAVRTGALLRVRRDHYALPGTDRHTVEAVRIGGRLACVSALADLGIFAFEHHSTHVHLVEQMSRTRSPHNRFARLTASNRAGTVLHWIPLAAPAEGTNFRVGLVDALIQTVRCQQPHHAIASIDNALFLGAITEGDVGTIFAALPARYQPMRSRLDARSESGQESVLRLLLLDAGLRVDCQVVIPGVGRVDFLVEGTLVLEADSRLAHDGWERHVADRTRDARCAELGHPTLRVLYEFVMNDPEFVLRSILGALQAAGVSVGVSVGVGVGVGLA